MSCPGGSLTLMQAARREFSQERLGAAARRAEPRVPIAERAPGTLTRNNFDLISFVRNLFQALMINHL